MNDVRNLLRRAVPTPSRPFDVNATAAAAHERLRRRWLRLRGAAITAIAVVASAASIAAFSGGGGSHRVEIAAGSKATIADASTSIDLPADWQQLPVVDRTAPTEILVVGTAPRPAGDPITACAHDERSPQARAAYLTLYEYRAGDALAMVGDQGLFTAESFQPRPEDFRTASTVGIGDCAAPEPTAVAPTEVAPTDPTVTSTSAGDATTTTTADASTPGSTVIANPAPPLGDHFRQITFSVDNRMFLARIVSVGDPGEELLNQGFDVLNSLVVDAPIAVTTTSSEAAPFDKHAARQQIVDAINASFGTPSPVPSAISVEGGHPFADPDAAAAAAATAQTSDTLTRSSYKASQEGKLVARINWIVFDSPTYARLEFDVLNDGEFATATTTGYAVFEDGNWRLGRGTFCEIAGRGGVQCPP